MSAVPAGVGCPANWKVMSIICSIVFSHRCI